MKNEVKKEILFDLTKTIDILKVKEIHDIQELEKLSEHTIDDVALYKDLDLISVTVLIYSLFKVVRCFTPKDHASIVKELQGARDSLQKNNFGKYNHHIRSLYSIVRSCNAKIKVHLQDVMNAARIKKGTSLIERGLSIGQAAGLMGLSNWDLQAYAGRTTALGEHRESLLAKKRLMHAFKIFSIK